MKRKAADPHIGPPATTLRVPPSARLPGVMLAAFAGAALLCAPGLAQTGAPSWQALIEHVVTLDAEALDSSHDNGKGRRMELSALAWDAQAQVLVAASDRGRLYRYQLAGAGGSLKPQKVSAQRLERNGAGARANLEGLAWRPGPAGTAGELLLAEEFGTGVQRRTAEGALIGTLSWPPAVAQALAVQAPGKSAHGVEAIGYHPRHGLLAGLQRPVPSAAVAGNTASADRPRHWVHAADGTRWAFHTAGQRSHLKALEVLADGSLLLLERVRDAGDPGLRVVLRRLDPLQCDASRLCAAPELVQRPAPLAGLDNYEGLACMPRLEGPCWLVSDDGGASEPARQTRLVQFTLVRP